MRYPEAYLQLNHDQHRCRVEEISPGAACVRATKVEDLVEGAKVMLEIPDYGRVPAEVILLPDGTIGLLFLHNGEAQQAMRDWILRHTGEPEAMPQIH